MNLVTGGSGLLGTALIKELLLQGRKVRAIYNKTLLPSFKSEGLEQVQCNILDITGLEESMLGIDRVYHCAAVVSFNPRKKREMFKINIEGTANIVNTALDAGVKKLVHVSSVAALGRIRENEPITENMHWTAETSNSSYGQSKYLGELEVWRGIGEGLDAVIVNPSLILGPGDWGGGSARIFKSVYEEFPWYTEGITGFVDVRDVASVMIRLMDSDIVGQRFIVSAENRSFKEVFDLIANAFDKKKPSRKVTPVLAKMVSVAEAVKSLFSGTEPLVTRETALTALAKVNFDNSKLKQFLPSFSYRTVEDTIRETCSVLQQKINRQ